MHHTLCATCVHTCKQDASAKIMQCPKYQKRMTDSEFNAMLDELKDLETQAEGIRERAQDLIRETLDVAGPSDSDEPDDESGTAVDTEPGDESGTAVEDNPDESGEPEDEAPDA